MENCIENVKLFAENLYKQLVAIQFELKHEENKDSNFKLEDIQSMFGELKQKLLQLNVRTNFPVIQDNDDCNGLKMIEELMLHIENVVFVLKSIQAKENEKSNEEQSGLINEVLAYVMNTLWHVRVVEGKLDAITDCNPQIGRIRLHDIETYQQIQELLCIAEELAIDLEQLEQLLKKININEKLEFSMDGPLKKVKNYFEMFFLPTLYIRELLSEKYEEIRALRQRIEQIYKNLKNLSSV